MSWVLDLVFAAGCSGSWLVNVLATSCPVGTPMKYESHPGNPRAGGLHALQPPKGLGLRMDLYFVLCCDAARVGWSCGCVALMCSIEGARWFWTLSVLLINAEATLRIM